MKPAVLVAVCLATLVSCVDAQTDINCDPAARNYANSAVGLDFRTLVRSPIAEILSQGEKEFFQGASALVTWGEVTESQIPSLWKNHVQALLRTKLPDFKDSSLEPSIYFFRINTPDMFQQLRACVEPSDEVLFYIKDLPAYPEVNTISG